MAQTSTTLVASKQHISDKTGTIISFTKTGTEYKISSSDTGTINLGSYSQFDLITVSGASNSGNNSTFTVKSVSDSNDFIIVEEEVTTESAGQRITLNHIGFVSDKFKGDGYYSQPDGVHTVSYTLSASYTADAILKMQGSLATTPTEDDWFDISGTSFTTDGTTIIKNVSFNFTGNIVWVRAKATGVTGGTINSVLLNN